MSPFHDIFSQIFNSTERVLSILQKTTLLIIRYGHISTCWGAFLILYIVSRENYNKISPCTVRCRAMLMFCRLIFISFRGEHIIQCGEKNYVD